MYQVFTTTEISQITGFTIKQLKYWADCGLVIPSVQQSKGPGTRKLYNIEDLIKLQFIKRLRGHGWSIQKIRTAIETLRTVMNDPDPLTKAILVHGKGTLIALCKTKEGERIMLDALNTSGQQIMSIALDVLAEEVRLVAANVVGEE